ncbi:uncharacterized protein LOC108818063 [Raphanus sativus]|uniref:Uncharacterized protein LOC108818063 n=1 Tax=Raphanus sativus TaxID=3726 RepID=A0A6J0KEU3_RAPSA|nr:uncharacterized protein LOC108818063 [Raphanus sativus]
MPLLLIEIQAHHPIALSVIGFLPCVTLSLLRRIEVSLLLSNMSTPRRSARLQPSGDAPCNPSPNPSAVSQAPSASCTRKYARKRPRRPTRSTPSREPSEPADDPTSESDDDTADVTPEHVAPQDPPQAGDEADCTELISKNIRHATIRDAFQARIRENPELLKPSNRPFNRLFASFAATERYHSLENRKFLEQLRLPLSDEDLQDVKEVVLQSGLIYTLIDVDPFQPSVVREFIANLPDAEERDDGLAVYVRGAVVNFSPSLINSIYCTTGEDKEPSWMKENIDEVCGFLTEGRVRRWEDMSSKYLTPQNQVLYKLVCSNWIPTTAYTAMNIERLRFVYMLHHHTRFDFGKLVYNQITSMAENIKTEQSRRILFPTLIQQVLLAQRSIPPDSSDEDLIECPRAVVKDKKAGLGDGIVSRAPNLEEDVLHAIAELKAIHIRLKRGDYGVIGSTSASADQEEN